MTMPSAVFPLSGPSVAVIVMPHGVLLVSTLYVAEYVCLSFLSATTTLLSAVKRTTVPLIRSSGSFIPSFSSATTAQVPTSFAGSALSALAGSAAVAAAAANTITPTPSRNVVRMSASFFAIKVGGLPVPGPGGTAYKSGANRLHGDLFFLGDALQVGEQLLRRLVAVFLVAGQHLDDHRLERLGDVRLVVPRLDQRPAVDQRQRLLRVGPLERRHPGEPGVDHRPQAVNVRQAVHVG